MSKSAKLSLGEKEIELPVIEGTEGERAVDISKLRAETGFITFDNGLGNTGACISDITFIDGEKGILKHRGYMIENLCEKSSFLEVSYLLYNNRMPSADELSNLKKQIKENSKVQISTIKEGHGNSLKIMESRN